MNDPQLDAAKAGLNGVSAIANDPIQMLGVAEDPMALAVLGIGGLMGIGRALVSIAESLNRMQEGDS